MATNDCLKDIVDKAYETKSASDIIKASPSALQGVSDADAAALKSAFGIKTVEDLATHKFILRAQALVTLAHAEKKK